MATVNAILRKDHPLKDGSFPIVIRVTVDSKNRYISLNESATDLQWSKKNANVNAKHKDELRVNRLIRKTLFEVQDKIDDFRQKRITPTLDDLISDKKKETEFNFFTFAEEKRDGYLKTGQQGTYIILKVILKKFKEFSKEDLSFGEITKDYLLEYKKNLVDKGNKANTIHTNFKVLRRIYNEGVKKGLVTGSNPFVDLEIHTEESFKERLTINEIHAIEALTISTPAMKLSRDMFIFSFYCWGMRFRDVALLTKENVKGEILSYSTSKSNFTKRITQKMDETPLKIINQYYKEESPYLFPLLKKTYEDPLRYEAAISTINAVVNGSLKTIAQRAGIDKTLTFHTARHSFVDILMKEGVSTEKRMQMVGHTSEKIHKKYHGQYDFSEMSKMVGDILNKKGA